MFDIYFRQYLSGQDKRTIAAVVMAAIILGLLGIIINFDQSIMPGYLTVGRILGILGILCFIWVESPNKGMYTSADSKRLFVIKIALAAAILGLFNFVIKFNSTIGGIDQFTVGRLVVAALVVSLYCLYK